MGAAQCALSTFLKGSQSILEALMSAAVVITLTDKQLKAIESQRPERPTRAVALEDLLDFVSETDIRLKGHRIWLEHIIEHYQAGLSAAAIAARFPGVAIEKIYAAITYYLANRAAWDERLRQIDRQGEQALAAQSETPAGKRLREITGTGDEG
jgi:uncharacterized protein (DUF433 family)